jgi:hypothetical protein
MKAAAVLLLALGTAAAAAAPAAPKPGPVGCDAFMRDLPTGLPGYHLSFAKPLTIARGFGELMSGVDVRVLSSDTKLDGTLKCRDDTFLRFELRATMPAEAKVLDDLDKFERAALMAAFRWDRAKAETVEKAMTADAGEYLRASLQRGDIYAAGKVEYHQADSIDLGLIWTATDHTFVIAAQTDD